MQKFIKNTKKYLLISKQQTTKTIQSQQIQGF